MERVVCYYRHDRSLMQQPTAWTHQEHMSFSLSTEHMELLLALGRGDYTMLFDPSKRDALQKIAAAILAASRSSTIVSFALSDPEPWERLLRAQTRLFSFDYPQCCHPCIL